MKTLVVIAGLCLVGYGFWLNQKEKCGCSGKDAAKPDGGGTMSGGSAAGGTLTPVTASSSDVAPGAPGVTSVPSAGYAIDGMAVASNGALVTADDQFSPVQHYDASFQAAIAPPLTTITGNVDGITINDGQEFVNS